MNIFKKRSKSPQPVADAATCASTSQYSIEDFINQHAERPESEHDEDARALVDRKAGIRHRRTHSETNNRRGLGPLTRLCVFTSCCKERPRFYGEVRHQSRYESPRTDLDVWLAEQGFERFQIPGDGSCLFRAVSQLEYGSQLEHAFLRRRCVDELRQHRARYEPFVAGAGGGEWEAYVRQLACESTWAGEVELQALSMCLRRNVTVLERGAPPRTLDNGFERHLALLYSDGCHFDALLSTRRAAVEAALQSVVCGLVDRVLAARTFEREPPPPPPLLRNFELVRWRRSRAARSRRDAAAAERLAHRRPRRRAEATPDDARDRDTQRANR